MIDPDEIRAKARELDVHEANVERDYVFGWLLKGIFENDYLRRRLVFKGGNCLRKAFYPDTRFSSDLDFSAGDALDVAVLAAEINRCCEDVGAACGVEFLTARNTFAEGPALDRQRRSYKGRVYFTDFSGQQDDLTISVRLDVTDFDRLHLPAVTRPLLHGYSDDAACTADLVCMSLEEIVANKLKCLIQRRHSHDLFDLVYATFIDRSMEVDRGQVMRTFFGKTIFRSSPMAAKEILLGIPMTFFGGVWDRYIRCPKTTRFGFDRASEGFRHSIEELFDGFGGWDRGERLFFGSEHRNAIMEAGAGRKVLRLTYDGVERMVEPYALSYKQAAGKPAREYFYGYDRTGGRTSPPGIKSFLNTGVQRIDLTDDVFEPRYEIELSKAGEEARRGYFGRQFRAEGRTSQARRPSRSPFQQAHKVQCPYCQKLFSRTTTSLDLRAHKSPDGYPCRARRGIRSF